MEWLRALLKQLLVHESSSAYGYDEDELEKRLSANRSISELLPYKSYDAQSRIFDLGDHQAVCLLAQPATFLGIEEIRNLEAIMCQAAPDIGYLQVMLISSPYYHDFLHHWQQDKVDANACHHSYLIKKMRQYRSQYYERADWQSFFNDESVLAKEVYFLFSLMMPVDRSGRAEKNHEINSRLDAWRVQVQGLLKAARIHAMNVDERLLMLTLRNLLLPRRCAAQQAQDIDDYEFPRSAVSDDSSILIHADRIDLRWRDMTVEWGSMSVKGYPETWTASRNGEFLGAFFHAHLQAASPFALILNVHLPDAYTEKVNAQARLLRATQMQNTELGRYVSAWKMRQRDWYWVQQKLAQGSRMVKYSFQVVSWSLPGRRLVSHQAIKNVFQRLGWNLIDDSHSLIYRWLTSLPMNFGPELYRILATLGYCQTGCSWTVAQFMPVMGEWKGNVGCQSYPLLMLLGRRGQLMQLNPFANDKGNYNIAVAATSGAGKSFLTQEYACSVLAAGGSVYIIDAGGSYKNLCELLQGRYIDLAEAASVNINPFSDLNGSREVFIDNLPMFKSLLAVMASPESRLESKQNAVLEVALVRAATDLAYKDLSVDAVISALQAMSEQTAHDLAIMLQPYAQHGAYGRYFSNQNSVFTSQGLLVLELEGLNASADLQSVVLLCLIQKITQTMYRGRRDRYKLCIIDEAWRLLAHSQASQFIEEGYRTARKYGGAFMTLTQSLQDYKKSPAAAACLNNSDYLFLLRQKPEAIDQARSEGQLMIGDMEEKMLRSLTTAAGKYSEIAIKSPEGWALGRLIVDPWAEKMMSTNPEDWTALKMAEAKGITKIHAITLLAGLRDEQD